MSKYQELVDQYQQAKSSDTSRWDDLFGIARDIGKGFTSYLEAPVENTVDINGVKAPVVALGQLEGETFVIRGMDKWEKADRSLIFALRLTFDTLANRKPSNFVCFSMVLSHTPSGFKINFGGGGEVVFVRGELKPVFEELFRRATDQLNKVN